MVTKEEFEKAVIAKVGEEEYRRQIAGLQESINDLRKLPQYSQYISQHKLSLLDSRFDTMDALLNLGILH